MDAETHQADHERIEINVRIVGVLSKPTGKDAFTYALPKGQTVKDLLVALGYPARHIPFIVPLINSKAVDQKQVLEHRDEVLLTLPVGGG